MVGAFDMSELKLGKLLNWLGAKVVRGGEDHAAQVRLPWGDKFLVVAVRFASPEEIKKWGEHDTNGTGGKPGG